MRLDARRELYPYEHTTCRSLLVTQLEFASLPRARNVPVWQKLSVNTSFLLHPNVEFVQSFITVLLGTRLMIAPSVHQEANLAWRRTSWAAVGLGSCQQRVVIFTVMACAELLQ